MNIHESDFRLGELILFISQKSVDDPRFGAVKLNKLLFYSDALAYAKWGESITGTEYWNQREGPVPKRLVQVRTKLIEEQPQALAIQSIDLGLRNPQQRTVALRAPKLGDFRGDRLLLIEDIIREYWNSTGTDLSNKSHLEWGWKLTSRDESVDLRTILLSPVQLSEQEQKHALEIIEKDADLQRQLQTLTA
jgi:hypothetical protein